nr:MAG TPA: hypothetical protein [Caudoviricetes sp.]
MSNFQNSCQAYYIRNITSVILYYNIYIYNYIIYLKVYIKTNLKVSLPKTPVFGTTKD